VLFVCQGNLCRSPYAAMAFRARLAARGGTGIEVESIGLVGRDRRSPDRIVAVARERGVDLAGHTSRLIDAPTVSAADLVVVMEPEQRRTMLRRFRKSRVIVLVDLDPSPVEVRRIPDPMKRSAGVTRSIFAQIDRCVTRLAEQVAGRSDGSEGGT